MLIHAITAKRAIAMIWIRCSKVSGASLKYESETLWKAIPARNSLKAFLIPFYNGCFPGVATGIEMARRDDEFRQRTAVWTLLVHMRKRYILGYALLPAPVPNAL
jgi:hypothetical protein